AAAAARPARPPPPAGHLGQGADAWCLPGTRDADQIADVFARWELRSGIAGGVIGRQLGWILHAGTEPPAGLLQDICAVGRTDAYAGVLHPPDEHPTAPGLT